MLQILPIFSAPTQATDQVKTVSSTEPVHPGDLWRLGEHLLLCGDCTDPDVVARLMRADQKPNFGDNQDNSPDRTLVPETAWADMLFLDPPYGVAYHSARAPLHKVRPLTGDNLGEYGTYDLLRRALLAAPLKPGGVFYICSTSGPNETFFRLAIRDAGLSHKQSLTWVKHHFVLGHQDYQWKHETLLYGWKPGAGHYFGGGRTQTTVWEIARPNKSVLHPTMKPLILAHRAIANSSRPGETVFDGFGGSGTTLLACEATGRWCRMLEIEPHYCDVILQRWEEATGKKATLITERSGC